jgi:thioredoxin 1
MKMILYFTAEWCGPCKQTKPIVEELNREQIMAKFFIIDVDSEIEMTQDFGVRSIPTFIVMKDNKEVHRVTGAQTRQQLEELIRYEQQ